MLPGLPGGRGVQPTTAEAWHEAQAAPPAEVAQVLAWHPPGHMHLLPFLISEGENVLRFETKEP